MLCYVSLHPRDSKLYRIDVGEAEQSRKGKVNLATWGLDRIYRSLSLPDWPRSQSGLGRQWALKTLSISFFKFSACFSVGWVPFPREITGKEKESPHRPRGRLDIKCTFVHTNGRKSRVLCPPRLISQFTKQTIELRFGPFWATFTNLILGDHVIQDLKYEWIHGFHYLLICIGKPFFPAVQTSRRMK